MANLGFTQVDMREARPGELTAIPQESTVAERGINTLEQLNAEAMLALKRLRDFRDRVTGSPPVPESPSKEQARLRAVGFVPNLQLQSETLAKTLQAMREVLNELEAIA